VTEVISLDTSLSSHLLRIVNSAYYSFPFPIDTVIRAVTLIGTREISTLALSSSFLNMFKKSSDAIDVEQFWRHSLGCAIIARALALKSRKSNPDRHFVSGLLHDIGRLVLASNIPEVASRVQAVARAEQVPVSQVEEKVLGFDHSAFGGSLAGKWSFPSTLTKAIRNHHAPYLAQEFSEPATVHVADIVVKALGIGFSGQAQVPPLDGQTWERLGIPEGEFAPSLSGLEQEMEATFAVLLSGKRPGSPRRK
jgi:HD-like signal output (HDOD) protein